MYRKSIYSTNERFHDVLNEVHYLLSDGKAQSNIVEMLSEKYQEKEILGLIKNLKALSNLSNYKKLKNLLRFSLLYLLVLKIYTTPLILNTITLPVGWKVILYFLSLVILSVALFLAFDERPYSYVVIFIILFLNLILGNVLGDIFELIKNFTISLTWFISASAILFFTISLISSWRLEKLLPVNLMNLRKRVNESKLMFNEFFPDD